MNKFALVLAAALAVAACGQNTDRTTVTNNTVEQVDGNTTTMQTDMTVVNDQ